VREHFYHREKVRLSGPNQLEVVVSIQCFEFEAAIIASYGLKHFIIIERMPDPFKDFSDEWRKIDNNIYLGEFLSGAHSEPVISPAQVQVFKRRASSGPTNERQQATPASRHGTLLRRRLPCGRASTTSGRLVARMRANCSIDRNPD
jgi:hypothetical protein